MNEIDATMVRDLYQAAWHEPAVISAGPDGWHQVEPESAAVKAGRRVICTQDWLDRRFGGRPLGDDDFGQAARELTAKCPVPAGDLTAARACVERFCARPSNVGGPPDIREAKELMPRLLAVTDKVLALHGTGPSGWCDECRDAYGEPVEWPCATVQAITAALTGKVPDARR